MTENEITGDILDAAIKIHRKFGPGMLESVYERLLEAELLKRGHSVERQKSVSFEYEGMTLEDAFRVDLLVDERIVVELKAVEKMKPLFLKQVKTYLVAMNLRRLDCLSTSAGRNASINPINLCALCLSAPRRETKRRRARRRAPGRRQTHPPSGIMLTATANNHQRRNIRLATVS